MQRLESTKRYKKKRARRVSPPITAAGASGDNTSLADTVKEYMRRTSASNRPPYTREQAGAMARLFTDAIKIWNLSDEEAEAVLRGLSLQTLAQWARDEVEHLDQGHCDRLVRLILVHQGLRYVFDDPDDSYAWIRQTAPLFDGRTALEFITDADLAELEWFHRWLKWARIG